LIIIVYCFIIIFLLISIPELKKMNRNAARPQQALPQVKTKRGSIDLTLYIKAAQQLGYDSRKVRKGTEEYKKIMALKNKLKSAIDS